MRLTSRLRITTAKRLTTLTIGIAALALVAGCASPVTSAVSPNQAGPLNVSNVSIKAKKGDHKSNNVTRYEAQTEWDAAPQPNVTERDIEVAPGVTLRVWDSGGKGTPIIFLHPYSSSGEGFPYQHEELADRGYRTISYSRRGHLGSTAGPADATGTVAGDLQLLVDKLGINKFHLVGIAAGGMHVFDYALSHPERLRSATIASSLVGITEADWNEVTMAILPEQWFELPGDFQELGPSYRAANRPGVEEWKAVEERSKPDGVPPRQGATHTMTWDAVGQIRTPVLVATGDADLYMPPARMRVIVEHLTNGQGAIISEAGHAPHWEQPDAFNEALLKFIRKYDKGNGPKG